MRRFLAIMLISIPAVVCAQPLWSVERDGLAVDHAMLDDLLAGRTPEFTAAVEGRDFRVTVARRSGPNLGVSSLLGRFDGEPESFFLLCRGASGATVAYLQPGDGTAYKLDHTTGRDDLRPVDFARLGPCGGGLSPANLPGRPRSRHPAAIPVPAAGGSRAVADDGSRLDVVIGYTPAAEAAMGGYDYIQAEAQLAVEAANLTYDNSEVQADLRLVHVMETAYDEGVAWEYEDHLYSLHDPDDGYMDDVLAMRDRVGADFATVLVDGQDWVGDVTTCGVAPVMQPDMINADFEQYALSIVSVQCAATVWTLSHEIGHNRGCAHNRESATIDGAYSYSYGLRFYYDPDTDTGFRTVMAYDHPDGGFARVPYYSNPDVTFAGYPTGNPLGLVDEAHNALTQNNTSALCAGFRSERTFVEFRYTGYSDGSILFPYPTITQAVTGSRDGGHIVLNNGDPDIVGVLADPRVYVHDGPGSAVLGGN